MKVYLQIALRNLLQARRRTAFLGTAIAAVTMLLVLLSALSQGIKDNLIFASTAISTGHVNVSGFYKAAPGDAAPLVTDAATVRRILEEEIDGVVEVIDRGNGFGKLVSETGSMQAVLQGVDITRESRFLEAIQLAPESAYREGGRDEVLGDARALTEPGTVLLFVDQARRLGITVGDTLTIKTETLKGATNTADVRVVAIAHDIGLMSGWYAFVNADALRVLYQLREDTTGALKIYLDDIERSDEVVGQVRTVLLEHGYELMDYDPRPYFMKFEQVMSEDWTGQKLDVTKWEDEVSFMVWILTAVDMVSFILVSVLTVIIVIGIMNTMWIAVRERTREVGTLRAIGMRKRQILIMFMTEAVLLGAAATVLGAVLGALIALSIDAAGIRAPIEAMQIVLMSDTIGMSVQPGQLVSAVVLFTTITALSAVWPSVRASRLQPVTAIHHIE